MSTIWTPGGEHPLSEPPSADSPTSSPSSAESGAPSSDEELAAAQEHLQRIREELAATPVRDIVANHAIGLWQLAILHLGLDREGAEADLPEAQLAIDAMAALVEGVADCLGEHTPMLREALANLQLAYVHVRNADLDDDTPIHDDEAGNQTGDSAHEAPPGSAESSLP